MRTPHIGGQDFIQDIALSMPGGLYQFTRRPDGSYALPYISERFSEITGVTAAEVRDDATAAFAHVHRDDLPGLRKSIENSAATLKTWIADFRICRADGSELWLRGQSTPHKFDDGTVVWNGVMLDVTDVKNADAALRRSHAELEQLVAERTSTVIESERRWHFALEGAGDGVWDWNAQTNQVFYSRRWKEMLGYGEDEIGDTLAERDNRVHPDDEEQRYADLQRHFHGETPFYANEHRVRCKDGGYKWILDRGMVVERTASGALARVIGTYTDISVRKQTEVTLRERDTEMRALIETAVDGIVTIDDRGIVKSFNPAAAKIFGYQPAEVLGRNVSMLMPDPDRSSHDGYLRNYLCGGPNRIIGIGREVRGARKDGSTFPLDLSVSEMKFADRRMFLGLVRDITERKRAEDEIVAAKDAAERASRAKSEFLSSMSHELRTPLNAIIGFSQLIESNPVDPLSATQKEYIDNVIKSGWHLLNLINEVLDLARVENGQIQVFLEDVALDLVLPDCLPLVQLAADKRGIRIVNLVPATDRIALTADPMRLKQVLLNLLSNAVKYNRDGGTVTIEVSRPTSERVRVAVQDTGRGLTADQVSRLFQPFERLDAEHDAVEGIGIGLVISKRLVELMGGTMSVTSTHGVGSTFSVELPAASDAVEATAHITSAAAIDDKPAARSAPITRSVLYVEDNFANLNLVKHIFRRRPHINLVSAPDGILGLELARRQHFDLILLDINLPGLNGFEVKERLAESDSTRDVPVIAVSANTMPRDLERGQAAGFVRYISKPIDVLELLGTVDELLGVDGAATREIAASSRQESRLRFPPT